MSADKEQTSDTPRTDAAVVGRWGGGEEPGPEFVRADFARTLERELAVADNIIAERDRLLDELPCEQHGRCVPHAIEKVRTLLAAATQPVAGEEVAKILHEWRVELTVNPEHDELIRSTVTLLERLARERDAAVKREKQHGLSDERDTALLSAWTSNHHKNYPPYINLTMIRMKGDIVLTVRLPTKDGNTEAATSVVRFTRETWPEFLVLLAEANLRYSNLDNLDAIL